MADIVAGAGVGAFGVAGVYAGATATLGTCIIAALSPCGAEWCPLWG